MNELGVFDPDDIPYVVNEEVDVAPSAVNMIGISGASSLQSLKDSIKQPFGFNSRFKKIEDGDYDDDDDYSEETIEAIQQLRGRFNSMLDKCDAVLNSHLSDVSDLKSAEISMEFSGRGEYLAGAEEMLNRIFDQKQRKAVVNILSKEDESKAAVKLRALSFLKNYTDDAISTLVRFWKKCDYAPEQCTIIQRLLPDGLVALDIDWK